MRLSHLLFKVRVKIQKIIISLCSVFFSQKKETVYCKDCKFNLFPEMCTFVELSKTTKETPYGTEIIENEEIKNIAYKNSGMMMLPIYYASSMMGYNGDVIPTKYLNTKGKCKFYIKKWWKIWIR